MEVSGQIHAPAALSQGKSSWYQLDRSEYKILVGKPEWKRSLASPKRRWEHNIKMDLRGVG